MKVVYQLLVMALSMTSLSAHALSSNFIPPNALPVLPMVMEETRTLYPNPNDGYTPEFIASMITVESCISLTHSRCWRTDSQLLTYWNKSRGVKREQGVGLGQITRAYHRNGKLRFDKLSEMTRKYRTRLKGLNWGNIRDSEQLQVRLMALLAMEEWNTLPESMDRTNREYMTASAYNSGGGRVKQRRRECGMAARCDPNVWFGNVENYPRAGSFATRTLYGKRTAKMINNDHIEKVRAYKPRFQQWFDSNKK